MPINPDVLAEAKALIAKAGMGNFKACDSAPPATGGKSIEIALIDPPAREQGVPYFDKPNPARPDVVRSASILACLRDGELLEPVVLFQRAGDERYELRDGFHRLHLCAALGFTQIFAVFTKWQWDES
ncbi:ParB/Srx family N-terminal domain-containing protein [Bordetella sp. LUAb4]|uniref:ParB/Srx family N-terminal domain-containing protein n=1 Tax=Bordetella sp. LUAb4 TaxID=2843195 RepID=UPI001E34B285|nr:ParB/Srx family N-terminal domain-containing protein [Bordetella sp. LUAb4]